MPSRASTWPPVSSQSKNPTSSSAPVNPSIWRNLSLRRARQTRSAVELRNFSANSFGTRISDDFNTRVIRFVESNDTSDCTGNYTCTPPRPATPHPLENVPERSLEGTIVEAALYPVYRGYEPFNFIDLVDQWIFDLNELRAAYKNELSVLFTRIAKHLSKRRQLCPYLKLIKQLDRLVQDLTGLKSKMKTPAKYGQIDAECRVIGILLTEWLAKATRRYRQVTMQDCQGWRSDRCRRIVMLGMAREHEILVEGLKEEILARIAGFLKTLRNGDGKGCG